MSRRTQTGQQPRVAALRGLVADAEHGFLPALLLALTFLTGLVDAVSLLALGRVFVANMTGNVVFIGFALAGTPGFSLVASLAALTGFLVGAWVAGQMSARIGDRRRRFAVGMSTELALFVVAFGVLTIGHHDITRAAASLLAALLAVALGIQNGVVRTLGVPDLTTTVLTMTLTGIAADARSGVVVTRRLLAVTAMLVGGLVGALLVLHAGAPWALAAVVVLALVITACSVEASPRGRRPEAPAPVGRPVLERDRRP